MGALGHPRVWRVSIALGLMLGCAITPFGPLPEPGVIVVRNRSDRDIVRVALVSAPRGSPVRHGSVSPVPRGVSQVIVRPSDPPPLAREIEIHWNDAAGESWKVAVDLAEVLRDAQGGPREALVFELRPAGKLRTRVERRAH